MHSVHAKHHNYLLSVVDELLSQANRVRNLIGDAHWLSDGFHKEILLRNLLKRHIGNSYLVSHGFVIDPLNPSICSTEQDILIIDNSIEGPIFSNDDIIIAFPSQVVASISVKTSLTKSTLLDSIVGLSSVKKISQQIINNTSPIWCAAFFYEVDKKMKDCKKITSLIENEAISKLLSRYGDGIESTCMYLPNFICDASDLIFRIENKMVYSYKSEKLSTAAFLASLIDQLCCLKKLKSSEFAQMISKQKFHILDNHLIKTK